MLTIIFIFCRCTCTRCSKHDHCGSDACNTQVEK